MTNGGGTKNPYGCDGLPIFILLLILAAGLIIWLV